MNHPPRIISRDLVGFVRRRFRLDWHGVHGVSHWARVRHNGLYLAQRTGANRRVVELFAFLHDVERDHDGHDPEHGYRAAVLALELAGDLITIDEPELKLLMRACDGHSDGHTRADITVMTCWDADRLDLGRVGIRPAAEKLCTEAARNPDVIDWCYRSSTGKNGVSGQR